MDICLGQIVYSKAGHDKGRFLIVVKELDEQYVLIADGKTRLIEKPKRKKKKHLKFTNTVNEGIQKKLLNNEVITNAELRKVIDAFCLNIDDSSQGSKEV